MLSDERNNKTTYVTLYGMEKAEKDTADMSVKALESRPKTSSQPKTATIYPQMV